MPVLTVIKGTQRKEYSFCSPKLVSELLEETGELLQKPCGSRGICGKCAVILSGDISAPNEREQRLGCRLACQAQVFGDAQVILPETGDITQIQTGRGIAIKPDPPFTGNIGAAIDIGTTTVVLRRYDLCTGVCVGESASINPQTMIAADVMGRISAAQGGKLQLLRQQIHQTLQMLLYQAGGSADVLVVTGNTTMLYLLSGYDPQCLASAPFQADHLFDERLVVCNINAYLPTCISAFVGADTTCAVLASEMCSNDTALLCDIGTNGEIALWKGGKLYVTSTAAGPAFEGAGISCGCNSIPGAIDSVWTENGKLCVHTIRDTQAVGLCGSGLIDAAAALLELGFLDETGALEDGVIELTNHVILTQKDIRALQLAKGAIAAGIDTLLEMTNTAYEEIEVLYVAGGFGSHLNIDSAAKIGLIPETLSQKVKVIGNAALDGATQILLDAQKLEEARTIAADAQYLHLGGNTKFNDLFVENMIFSKSN